ncbi:MAG: ribosome small subunit-dependent GTPase A [Bacteroidetes bacterium]|nr:ribosome small subunit-dependent GTPase A [Bacteroidota bacterium]
MNALGLVIKSTGSWYSVRLPDGSLRECRLKGRIRLDGIKSTNPVVVGDTVHIQLDNNTISGIAPRRNFLVRRSNNLSKYAHVIAANIDLAMLIVSEKNPRTSLGFIDRFLLTCQAYGIQACLVLNKLDQLDQAEMAIANERLSIYERLDYPTLRVSALTGTHLAELKGILNGKVSLISGHSGVGKSSLINRLIPQAALRVGEVSKVNYKGKHTTTFAEMLCLSDDSYLIDTPGIKDFGLVHMDRHEVSHYFKEMAPLLAQCKFGNCLHLEEPGCGVLHALDNGLIDPRRYKSYVGIVMGDEEINNPDYLWRKTLD